MWIIGLIVGAVIGGTIEDIEGAVFGAAVGLLVGYVVQRLLDQRELLNRLKAIELHLTSLDQRITRIESLRDVVPATTQGLEAAGDESPAAPVDGFAESESMAEPTYSNVAEPTAASVSAYSDLPDFDAMPAYRTASASVSSPTYQAPPPAPPTGIAALPAMAWGWLTGGNTIVRVGVIVLFFGVAFLLKYAYDHTHIPPAVRVAFVAFGGIVLLALGWRLRHKRFSYALALQGAGVGVLYLSAFAALRLYNLIEPGFAFGLLIAICAFSTWMALLQNAQSLAILAFAGGFIAPILVSTGSGNYIALFSYYAVLNAGVLAISIKKAWRPLNLVGFVFTFLVSAAWGERSYEPEKWSTTQPFLALFFVIYLLIPAFFARNASGKTERYLDGTLVFGLPVIAFGLQYALVRHFEYGVAISALIVSLIYFLAARWVKSHQGQSAPMVTAAFSSLCIVFATLTVPFAVDGGWTAAAWALEGAALVWVGMRQNSWLQRSFGYVLQLLAGGFFLSAVGNAPDTMPLFNRPALGFVLLSLAAFFTGHITQRDHTRLKTAEVIVPLVALGIGLLWWAIGGCIEIDRYAPSHTKLTWFLGFLVVSCVAFEWIGARINWQALRSAAFGLMPIAALAFVMQMISADRFGNSYTTLGVAHYLMWPFVFLAHLWLMRKLDNAHHRVVNPLHTLGLWLLAAVAAWELHFRLTLLNSESSAWPIAAAALPASVILAWISTRGQRITWPIAARWNAYLVWGCGGIAAGLVMWLLWVTFTSTGETAPLPYVTILNPLDLMVLGVLLAMVFWLRAFERHDVGAVVSRNTTLRFGIPSVAAFIAANGILLRAIHQYAQVPWTFYDLTSSMLVQSALSIFWTLLALTMMILAHHWQRRVLWLVGAGLLAVAVAKLFLVDLSNVGGIERIISFVVVGILMLVVGYFAPVPPKAKPQTI